MQKVANVKYVQIGGKNDLRLLQNINKQNIERQERNIKSAYPSAVIIKEA